jgi:uncharacterized protein YutD
MLRDNACPHTAAARQDLIATFGWEQFDHPPYSRDLAPSDFHVHLHLKSFLGAQGFHDDEVKEAVNTWHHSTMQGYKNWCTATSTLIVVETMSKSSVRYANQMAI